MIQDVIMARVDSLPEGSKELLQIGSIIEREFSYELINRVTGLPERELLSRLSVLKDSELLYERGIFPQSTYIFKHALTREVVYDSILTKKKKRLHEEIGHAIEEIYSERLEESYEMLAYHYSQSDNLEKTYEYLKVSGKKAVKNNSLREAYLYYKKAIDALNQLPLTDDNKRKQIEIMNLMGMPFKFISIPKDAMEIIERGEKFARELGDEQSIGFLKSVQDLFRWGRT